MVEPTPDFSDTDALDLDTVAGWVGERFVASGAHLGEPVPLTLARARDVTGTGSPSGFRSFALDFEGPVDRPLEQGTVDLAAEDGDVPGAPVFLVPVAEREGVRVYEATFSLAPPEPGDTSSAG